jgi:hypothetical protein
MTAPSYLAGVARRSDRSVPRLRPPFLLYPPSIRNDSTATTAQAGSPRELHAVDLERARIATQTNALPSGGSRQGWAEGHRPHETAAAMADTKPRAAGAQAGWPVAGTDSLGLPAERHGAIDKRQLEVSSGEAIDAPRTRAPRSRRPANLRSSEREATPAAGTFAAVVRGASSGAGPRVGVIADASEASGENRSDPTVLRETGPKRQGGVSHRPRRQPVTELWPDFENGDVPKAASLSVTYKGRARDHRALAGRAGYEIQPAGQPPATVGLGTVERASNPRPDRPASEFRRPAGQPEVRIGTIEVRVVQPENQKPAPAPASRPRSRGQSEAAGRRLARGFLGTAGLGQV